MKIKRFHAADVRQTIRKVRDTLGPDAVILSNRHVEDGIEIVAAIDYDESLLGGTIVQPYPEREQEQQQTDTDDDSTAFTVPGSRADALNDIKYSRNIPESVSRVRLQDPQPEQTHQIMPNYQPALNDVQTEIKSLRGLLLNQLSGLSWETETKMHPLRSRLLQRLIALGLSPAVSKNLCKQIEENQDFDHMWRQSLGLLSHQLPVVSDEIIQTAGVVAIVGPTGVGKTTSIAKLAARYVLKHGRDSVGLISTDNFRVGAQDQLRSYARIMGVSMRVATDKPELNDALYSLRKQKLILIDTTGVSLHDKQLRSQLEMLTEGAKQIRIFLTLAVNSQRSVLNEVINTFETVNPDGCILTKLDETTSLGGALSVAIEHQLPISYYCDGQNVPEDLHIARPHNLVSRSVAIMQKVSMITQDRPIDMTINGMLAHANG